MQRITTWLARHGTRAGSGWLEVKEGWAAVRPVWLAALIALGTSIALQNAQALDALQEIADGSGGAGISLFFSVALTAFAAWYFPRALLYVVYDRVTPLPPDRHKVLRRWVPRLLGLLPILSVALAYGRLGIWLHMLRYLVLAGLFFGFVVLRMRRRKRPGPGPKLPAVTFKIASLLVVLSVLSLIAFLVSKVTLPQLLGPLGILLMAASMWIGFGSMVLIYPSYRFSTPSGILILVLLAGAFSFFNDNHQVRRLAGPAEEWRQPFHEHVAGWRELRGADQSYPLFVVAAEGGGIRAAYWTAMVLAQLEDLNPGFSCHLFAVSGVSGGSLGGAVFAALVAELVEKGELRCDGQPFERQIDLAPRVREILGQDFLAPTLAGMLFPDVVQRFLPLPGRFALPDRARYLERSWEAAHPPFQRPLRELWLGEDAPHGRGPLPPRTRRYVVPSLFLNGTWVENGDRVVTTNLDIAEADSFVRLDDMLGCLGRSIRLSTAAHMSARFTYVSPAGTVRVADPSHCRAAKDVVGKRLHVVDGGYFENSGAQTAAEIIDQLRWPGPVIPIFISNNPENPNGGYRDEDSDSDSGRRTERRPFGDELSPLYALLHTREARGFHAEGALAARAGEGLRFQLRTEPEARRRRRGRREPNFPLGWTLSQRTEHQMERQAGSSAGLVRACRLMPSTPDDPDRCERVAKDTVAFCLESYPHVRRRCRALAGEAGVLPAG